MTSHFPGLIQALHCQVGGGGGGLQLALKELCFKFTFNNSIFVIVEYFFYFQGAFVSIMFCFLNGEVSVFYFRETLDSLEA